MRKHRLSFASHHYFLLYNMLNESVTQFTVTNKSHSNACKVPSIQVQRKNHIHSSLSTLRLLVMGNLN